MAEFIWLDSIESQLGTISKNKNIVEQLKSCLVSWDYKSTISVGDFKEDIQQATEEIIDYLFPDNSNNENLLHLIQAFIHYEIYDALFFRIKEKYTKDDLKVYKICKEFCKNNGSPKQLGSTFYNFIPNAAVVELSMLSSKRMPMEKLKCLQCAYDYIFAEVKGALISVISKYSDKEIDLPSINNKEVIPIVMSVILKSKLFYFISDMSYMKEFGGDIFNKNRHLSEIFQVFGESLNKILHLKPYNEAIVEETLENKLSVCDTINFIDILNKEKENAHQPTVFNEERRRVARLITSATTENLSKYT